MGPRKVLNFKSLKLNIVVKILKLGKQLSIKNLKRNKTLPAISGVKQQNTFT